MNFVVIFIILFFGSEFAQALRTPANCGSHVGKWIWDSENAASLLVKDGKLNVLPDHVALGRDVLIYVVGVPWNTDTFKMEIHYNKTVGSEKVATVETYTWNKDLDYCKKGSEDRTKQYWSFCTFVFNDTFRMEPGFLKNEFKLPGSEFRLSIHQRSQSFQILRNSHSKRPKHRNGTADKVKFIFTTDEEKCTIDTSFQDCSVEYPFIVKPYGYGRRTFTNDYGSTARFSCAHGYNLRLKSRPNDELKNSEAWTECDAGATWRHAPMFMCVKTHQDQEG